jgi:peptidyl-prolyl cis-trans isomerase SurA
MKRRTVSSRIAAVLVCVALLLEGCGLFGWGKSRESHPLPLPDVLRDRVIAQDEAARAVERQRQLARQQPEIMDRVVAVVNQDVITMTELIEAVQISLQEGRKEIKPGDEEKLLEQMLQQMIERRLQVQEAAKEKLSVSDDEIKEQIEDMMKRSNTPTREQFEDGLKRQGLTIEAVRKGVREQLLVQKIRRRKVSSRFSVTDQEVDAYFKENREKLETGLAYHARHIVIPPSPAGQEEGWETARVKAEEVWEKLRAGEEFVQMAQQYSQDSTAKEGGDLGQLKRGELDQEFESHIFRLSPGQISGPVKTRLGYQIFKLESKEDLSGEALSQARSQVRDILYRDKFQARFEAWLDEIRKKALVEIRL